MPRTTISVQVTTRDRITAKAQTADVPIDAFLNRLLDEHDDRAFWASLDGLTPEAYAQAIATDGDALDESYGLEDAMLTEDRA